MTKRRNFLKAGLGASSLFLPVPYAWVWAQQSDGALKLLKAPKVALVIGNGSYRDAPALKNAPNDAKAIGAALKESGFDVTLKLDTGREEMLQAIRAYVHLMEQKKHVGLFYFAGHGVQLAWRNYLLPIDAVIDKIEDVAKQSVDIARLIEGLSKAANPMNVIILDACRENPFGKDFKVEHKGLSQMDAPNLTFLAYATSPGNVASDGDGANGLYTENLLREIKVPEAKIEDVFKRVRLSVRRKSNGAQVPWESTSLEDDFWFNPPKELRKISEEEKERAFKEEAALWDKARESKTPGPIEEYLRRYPSGQFTELAQLQLDRVLARQGEKKIEFAPQQGNPFTKGTATVDINCKVGDTYVANLLDLQTRVLQRTITSTIERLSDSEVIFSSGMILDLMGNPRQLPDGRSYTGMQTAPAEFAIGKHWETKYQARHPSGTALKEEITFRIVARESITVPGGTFNAFRIEGNGFGVAAGASGGYQIKSTRWLDPERVRLVAIASEVTVRSGGRISRADRLELASFKQS